MTLTCRELSFAYRVGRPVLDRVSFTAPVGVTVILGANGAGKSTLLRLLAGLLAPTSGEVTLAGDAVHAMPHRRRARQIAYLAQQPLVSAALTARQVVALSRVIIGPSDRAVEAALDRAALTPLAHEPFHALSAGQQQRVMLARAAAQLFDESPGAPANRAKALLVDEPISAQDPRHAAGAIELLRGLARDASVVMVLHDPTLARRVADHAVLLGANGTVLEEGPPDRVITPAALERVYGVTFDEAHAGPDAFLFPRVPPRV